MPRPLVLPPPERLPGDFQRASGSGATYRSRAIARGEQVLADEEWLWGSILGARLDRAAIAALAALPDLRALFLGDVVIDDDAAPGLAELAALERLDLTRVALTPALLGVIPRLPALERLAIQGVAVADDQARALAGAAGLTSLAITCGDPPATLGDDGLAAIGRLPALTHLRIAGAPALRGGGLAPLAAAGRLTSLELTICGELTETAVIAHAPGLPRLIYLDLSFDRLLGDPAIAALAGLGALEGLMLRGLPRLGGAALRALAALPRLRSLHLSTSRAMKKIRGADLDALRAARPDLVIART